MQLYFKRGTVEAIALGLSLQYYHRGEHLSYDLISVIEYQFTFLAE